MYPSPYNTERPYSALDELTAETPCPICGALGTACPDAAGGPAMPTPPFDIPDESEADYAGPLRPYQVTQFGYLAVMQLNDRDAARYGSAATLIT